MAVNLRDRLFSDTGGAVSGATAQAVLVTGGGTDVGTSSAVVSTTTTDVNGMWKFTGLADPGAGNWYDVKITNGNQVRWRYGNIQAGINQLLFSSSIASTGSLTAATTVTAGTGLTVTTGTTLLGGALTQLGASGWAGAGLLRLPNNNGIDWRNAGNTSDDSINFNASDEFVIAPNLTTAARVNALGLYFNMANARIVPGATSLQLRNTADNANNILIADNGDTTFRGSLSGLVNLVLSGNITATGTVTGNDFTTTHLTSTGGVSSNGLTLTGAGTTNSSLTFTGGGSQGVYFNSTTSAPTSTAGVGYGGQHGSGNGAVAVLAGIAGSGFGPSVSATQQGWIQVSIDAQLAYIPVWR